MKTALLKRPLGRPPPTLLKRRLRTWSPEATRERVLLIQRENSILTFNILTEIKSANKELKASPSEACKEIAKLKVALSHKEMEKDNAEFNKWEKLQYTSLCKP
ncbi:hypothetical protein V6N13_096935 [Hibiscus sabdariffa]|uniref:Uncharacterized protein n=1 Tax=Hibiscus sabdariffa TaxID=183260 RepID=A0ABR2ASD2_9ROSI